MSIVNVRVSDAAHPTPKEDQLSWRIGRMATGVYGDNTDVTEMVINRVIDNAACAMAAINRHPVASARAQAVAHPRPGGATVLGLPAVTQVECEWAAWANGAAVRELDFHDTYMAAEAAHPGDTIPAVLAVAQQCGMDGADVVRGIATAYQVQISLAAAMALNPHRIDHVAHLGPAVAAGISAILGLDTEIAFQAINHAAHVSTATRQGRKGNLSTWKAFAPGHVAKCAVEAVDRAMRGETSPAPVYEGDYGIIATMLDGVEASYDVNLPDDGEARDAILVSYTKEHSAGYHGQAIIDLAFRMRHKISDFDAIERIDIFSKHYTHVVMGSGGGDRQKYDPEASRETLDHSAMFIFAVALEDGTWHHERSYAPERRRRPETLALWRKVRTHEDEAFNERYYNEPDPLKMDQGARAEITLKSGEKIIDELSHANAHPMGAASFGRTNYIHKLRTLSDDVCSEDSLSAFLSDVEQLDRLDKTQVGALALVADKIKLDHAHADSTGIF